MPILLRPFSRFPNSLLSSFLPLRGLETQKIEEPFSKRTFGRRRNGSGGCCAVGLLLFLFSSSTRFCEREKVFFPPFFAVLALFLFLSAVRKLSRRLQPKETVASRTPPRRETLSKRRARAESKLNLSEELSFSLSCFFSTTTTTATENKEEEEKKKKSLPPLQVGFVSSPLLFFSRRENGDVVVFGRGVFCLLVGERKKKREREERRGTEEREKREKRKKSKGAEKRNSFSQLVFLQTKQKKREEISSPLFFFSFSTKVS